MSLIKKETAIAYEIAYSQPLFEYADDNGVIKLCVIGSNELCEEYIKAAIWSTQRDDYRLLLDIFTSESECERLRKAMPEIFHTENLSDKNEIFYDVRLHIEAPFGEYAVIFSDNEGAVKYKRKITVPCYDEEFFVKSGLRQSALSLFCSFGNSADKFFSDEFSYRSSLASALFWLLRKKQGENVDVNVDNMKLEHRRWNAFTRTEGYRYDMVRDDEKKTHNCLVPWDMLKNDIKAYDAFPIKNLTS